MIEEYAGEDRVISSFEIRDRLKKDQGRVGFCVGIPKIDELVEGFQGGELVIITGKTGQGKSLFAQSLTALFSKMRVWSLWFSYEMTNRQFIERFPNLPLFYMPQTLVGNALNWIEQRIVEGIAKYGVKAVFVDHLHFLIDLAQKQNPSLQIGQIVRTLKLIALKYEIVIFLLCHVEKTKNDVPSINEIRDSGMIPAESDMVFVVWRIPDDEKKSEFNLSGVLIDKSRRTGAWRKKVKLIKEDGLLTQL